MDTTRQNKALEQLRKELIAGDMTTYREHYESYREAYVSFAKRYTDDLDLIHDSYQDAFIALYENVVQEKVLELKSSLRTYVFSIGKYTLFAKLKKKGKDVSMEDLGDIPTFPITPENDSDQVHEVRKALGELGNKCREILILFYYKRYTIDAIVQAMEYKNDNTAKAHKSRCLKKLKELVHQEAKQKK